MRTFEIKKEEIPEIQTQVCLFFYEAMKPPKKEKERGPGKHTVNPKKDNKNDIYQTM